ncbi:unnamed protein product, partial [Mesorhabditis belari]|uniref:Uncharacterized protein n=1 Tax=Mesorhabditis belari TaxID=2138241 RepID=A0AAF3EK19_9BILA
MVKELLSQGTVERANQDVKKILCTQLREEKSSKWAPNEVRNVTDIENEVFEGEKFDDWSEAILASSTENPSYFPKSDEKLDSDRKSVLTQRVAEIEQHRKGAVESQQKQADKMLEESKNRFGPVAVGMTIGTKNGVLQQKLTRNQFEPANKNFLSADDVPSQHITFRSAIGAESLSGTQGHKHCNCTNGCTNGRWSYCYWKEYWGWKSFLVAMKCEL